MLLKTLLILGCHFDCASKREIALVRSIAHELQLQQPDIIYANPCKSPQHIAYAVSQGNVDLCTFDNATELHKIAAISSKMKCVLRIMTDDRGSRCRFSSKFGAPRSQWRPLLQTAQSLGLQVVGVSFHVGSGCRDAALYTLALQDARQVFDIAQTEFGMDDMHILDIGGGFPGETHAIWNPASEIDALADDPTEDEQVGTKEEKGNEDENEQDDDRFMFFSEIAQHVAPAIDRLFPSPKVRVIGEPGRYFVAAAATLCCSVVSARSNIPINPMEQLLDQQNHDYAAATASSHKPVNDQQAAHAMDQMTRQDEDDVVAQHATHTSNQNHQHPPQQQQRSRGMSMEDAVLHSISEELADYTKLFSKQQLAQQEVDVYNDPLDLYQEGAETAADLLGPPDQEQYNDKQAQLHTVEGMPYPLVSASGGIPTEPSSSSNANNSFDQGDQENNKNDGDAPPMADADDSNQNQNSDTEQPPPPPPTSLLTLAAAGEAAVNGMVLQAVADATPLQDDFAYYINDGVYGAFNNIMFDHAHVRPRILFHNSNNNVKNQGALFASTVFGPTCDSIDVIARSVLLPQLQVGDWMYFQNMGAYTMAAASSFNGFAPSDVCYVCSVQPEYFESLIKGPEEEETETIQIETQEQEEDKDKMDPEVVREEKKEAQ